MRDMGRSILGHLQTDQSIQQQKRPSILYGQLRMQTYHKSFVALLSQRHKLSFQTSWRACGRGANIPTTWEPLVPSKRSATVEIHNHWLWSWKPTSIKYDKKLTMCATTDRQKVKCAWPFSVCRTRSEVFPFKNASTGP